MPGVVGRPIYLGRIGYVIDGVPVIVPVNFVLDGETVVVASFFLTTIAGLLQWPAWTNRPSVFDAFGSPYKGWPSAGSLAYLTALGVMGTAVAFAVMHRGDRVAP